MTKFFPRNLNDLIVTDVVDFKFLEKQGRMYGYSQHDNQYLITYMDFNYLFENINDDWQLIDVYKEEVE